MFCVCLLCVCCVFVVCVWCTSFLLFVFFVLFFVLTVGSILVCVYFLIFFDFLSPVAAQRSNKGARVVVDDSSPVGKKTAGHGRGPSVFDDEGATNFSNKL